MKLLIRDVRCFSGLHKIPIRPLTILVGENSTGKSTLLASLSVVSNSRSYPFRPGFNDPPYALGTYETIARWGSNPRNRVSSFSLGFIKDDNDSGGTEVSTTYIREKGQPAISKYKLTRESISLEINWTNSTLAGKLFLAKKDDHPEVRRSFEVALPTAVLPDLSHVVFSILRELQRKKDTSPEPQVTIEFERAFEIIDASQFSRIPCQSIAPIRTKPRRTYDQVKEEYTPEGDHVPIILANSLPLASESSQFAQLKQFVNEFGRESELFTQVTVRPLGRTPAGPFQILIKEAGGRYNLLDVGYGVSQVLPVIVQSILGGSESRTLLQQPEVHLHPRAQAALGSFFVNLVNELHANFVIETHSDYLIDRIRREVATGAIKQSDVLLLYFSKKAARTKIYPIEIDSLGNVRGAPRDYRRFFLAEEMQLLMRSAD